MLSSSLQFLLATAVSLATSWLFVSRIERIARRLGISEAMLGLVAALGANAPEITSSITALVRHQRQISAGVILGSNVFNLAALLGVGALVTGRIVLHRRLAVFTGAIAVWTGAACLATVVGAISAVVGLAVVLIVLVPYAILTATRGVVPRVVPCSSRLRGWLTSVVHEEEREVKAAIDAPPASLRDVIVAIGSLVSVVVASIVMEQSASNLGVRLNVPAIVVGGIVLAAVTSLPNAVAGIYLARRGRGAATVSTAFNSNALNVSVGYLLPAAIIGVGVVSGHATLVAAWYLSMAVALLVDARLGLGVRRGVGTAIVVAYAAFVVAVVVTS